jgi:hypothetical protein
MPAPAPPTSSFLGNLVRTAKADPKKAGVLAVLVTVLGGMWIRMALSGGPQSADASTSSKSDNEVVGAAHEGLRNYAPSAAGAAALAEWRKEPVNPVVRNLFTVQLDNYRHQDGAPSVPVTRVEEGFWDELAKSLSSQADQNKQRQIRTENAIRDAARMQLQTIVMSASPKAVIDGEMVEEGSVVAGFRVSKIEARRIIVEREGIKLEIPMK